VIYILMIEIFVSSMILKV